MFAALWAPAVCGWSRLKLCAVPDACRRSRVLVHDEIAAARVKVFTGEDGNAVDRVSLLGDEVTVAVDTHIGGDIAGGDVALDVVGRSGEGVDDAERLAVRRAFRDEIDEGGVASFLTGGLGVGDVVGNVLKRKGLRTQTTDCRGHRTENTHTSSITQLCDRPSSAEGPYTSPLFDSKPDSKHFMLEFNMLDGGRCGRRGKSCRAGHVLPGRNRPSPTGFAFRRRAGALRAPGKDCRTWLPQD
jgi:hypothetical protein